MKQWKNVFIISILAGGLSFAATAQDEEDLEYRRDRPTEEAINTNKETPVKIIDFIVGTWRSDGAKQAATAAAQPAETMIFTREKEYVSHAQDEAVDSGRFRVNEQHGFLYLESDEGGTPTEWLLSFPSEDELVMQSREDKSRVVRYSRIQG